jgi:hypothetical protein
MTRIFFGTRMTRIFFGTRMTRMTRIFLLPSAAFLGEFEIIALFNQKIAEGNFQNPRHPRHPRSKS